jgi:hypothetical protein
MTLTAYVHTRTRTTYSLSTPSRNPENCKFLVMLQQARLGRMHIHAIHYTNTTLVGSGCTYVHQGSRGFGGVSESEAAVEPPRRNSRLLFSSFHNQAKAPAGTPTTSGGCSSSAISGGATADSHSIRTSGAGVFRCLYGRPRHQQQPCGVALNIALLRLLSALVSVMAPQLRRNARIGRRGATTALSGLRGKLLVGG